jgi:hypothetical protein
LQFEASPGKGPISKITRMEGDRRGWKGRRKEGKIGI